MSTQRRLKRQDYTVAWLCALAWSEQVAAIGMLDEVHEDLPQPDGDDNTYTYGSIKGHNVIIACLPLGQPGTISASILVGPLRNSFPNLRIHLLVGIGGGIPYDPPSSDPERDVHLGDVVVGVAEKPGVAGVVQYDFERDHGEGNRELLGLQDKPDRRLLTALGKLFSLYALGKSNFCVHLERLKGLKLDFTRPARYGDRLYRSSYDHLDAGPGSTDCDSCLADGLVLRHERLGPDPVVHQGQILSGNSVIKNTLRRDELSRRFPNARCFEMEAAGLLDQTHCLVIRGISDYADSHKNQLWQPYAAGTAAAFAREFLLTIQPHAVIEIDPVAFPQKVSPPKPKPSSTVPFRRDPDFVDRDILAGVDEQCSQPASRAALVGLGGVGKSQLAIEYSYRVRQKSPQTWVFWIYASNRTRFEEGYRTIAERIKLPCRDEPTADILRLVRDWLCDEANGQWVMILDNADDPTVFFDTRGRKRKADRDSSIHAPTPLSAFLPQTQNGSMLVTSRSRDAAFRLTGSDRSIIAVEPMDESNALKLFTRKIEGNFDDDDAKRLLQALDYMPLAISQAASYIGQRSPRISVMRYLENFQKNERNATRLLDTDVGDLRRDPSAVRSICTTWTISFEYIRQERSSAARLLSLMSLFDRQGIPASLLRHHYDDGSEHEVNHHNNGNRNVVDDSEMDFEEDVYTLRNYSLIRATDAAGEIFDMHRLVQLSARRWLDIHGDAERWKKKYISTMWKSFPNGEYEHWATCQILFPHAQALLAYPPATDECVIHWMTVLNNAARYARSKGDYLMAEEMNRRALHEGEKVLGLEHPETLTSVSDLAIVFRSQGKYKTAEEMERRALNGREKALGPNHLDTIASVYNLAVVLCYQRKYKEAEDVNRRALNCYEKIAGPEHQCTLASISNLASIFCDQRNYEMAEKMCRRALEVNERVLGLEHPHTLISVSNLTSILRDQRSYEMAEKMCRRALEGREKVLGLKHPETLNSVSNLATIFCDQRNYEMAEKMCRRALEGREKVLRLEHPDTLRSVNNLATIFCDQRNYEMAENMYRRALEGREKVLGLEHPDTLNCVCDLAYLFRIQNRYDDASSLYRRALAGLSKVLGPGHPDTQVCSQDYASMVSEMES